MAPQPAISTKTACSGYVYVDDIIANVRLVLRSYFERKNTLNINLESKNKLWTYDFIIICIVSTVIRIGSMMHSTAMPLYMQFLGHNKTYAGLMTTFFSLSALVFRPIMGTLVDSKGRRNIMLLGTVIFSLTVISFGFITAFPVLFALQIIAGLGFSASGVSMTTVATDVIPTSKMTEGLGFFGLASTISSALAPMIALFFIDGSGGYSSYFTAAASLSVFTVAITFLVNYEKRRAKALANTRHIDVSVKEEAAVDMKWWERIVERTSILPSSMMLISGFAMASIAVFMPTFAKELKISDLGCYFTLSAVGQAFSRLVVGWFARRFGNIKILFAGYMIYFVCFAGIFFARDITAITILGFAFGLGFGLTQTILNSSAIINAPKARRGAANATFYMAMDIGIGFGSAAWGVVADNLGIRWIFMCAAGIVLIAMACSFFYRKKI